MFKFGLPSRIVFAQVILRLPTICVRGRQVTTHFPGRTLEMESRLPAKYYRTWLVKRTLELASLLGTSTRNLNVSPTIEWDDT